MSIACNEICCLKIGVESNEKKIKDWIGGEKPVWYEEKGNLLSWRGILIFKGRFGEREGRRGLKYNFNCFFYWALLFKGNGNG